MIHQWTTALMRFLWNLIKHSWSLQKEVEKARVKNPYCGHIMIENDKGDLYCAFGGCAQWMIEYQEDNLK